MLDHRWPPDVSFPLECHLNNNLLLIGNLPQIIENANVCKSVFILVIQAMSNQKVSHIQNFPASWSQV